MVKASDVMLKQASGLADMKDFNPGGCPTAAGEGLQRRQEPPVDDTYVLVLPPKPHAGGYAFPLSSPGWCILSKYVPRSLLIAPDNPTGDRNVDVRIMGLEHGDRVEAVKQLSRHLASSAPRVHGGLGFVSDLRRLLCTESSSLAVVGVDSHGNVTTAQTSLTFEELQEPAKFDYEQYCALAGQEWISAGGFGGRCRRLLATLERAWRRAHYLVWVGEMGEELSHVSDFVKTACSSSGAAHCESCATVTIRDSRNGWVPKEGRCGPEYVLVLCKPAQRPDLTFCRYQLDSHQWKGLTAALEAAEGKTCSLPPPPPSCYMYADHDTSEGLSVRGRSSTDVKSEHGGKAVAVQDKENEACAYTKPTYNLRTTARRVASGVGTEETGVWMASTAAAAAAVATVTMTAACVLRRRMA